MTKTGTISENWKAVKGYLCCLEWEGFNLNLGETTMKVQPDTGIISSSKTIPGDS